MALMPAIRKAVNKMTGAGAAAGAGLPTGVSYANKARFTGVGAGGGALAGGALGAATGAATSEDKLKGGLVGGLAGAGLGAVGGGLAANAAHGRALKVHAGRLQRGNQATSWKNVAKNDLGNVQAGSHAAKAEELAARHGIKEPISPHQAYHLEQFDKAKGVTGGQTFSSPDEFRKWIRTESMKVHPDRMAASGASPEQLEKARQRMADLTELQGNLNSGHYTPEQFGWGNWSFAKQSSISDFIVEKIASMYGISASPSNLFLDRSNRSVDLGLLVSSPSGDDDRALDLLNQFKSAAMAMPSVPTPQFPLGLAKVTPKSVSSAPLKATATTGTTKATNFTQVHSQPSVVNQSAYSGAKSVPAPSVKR